VEKIIEVDDGVMTARYAVAGTGERDGCEVIRAGEFLGSAGGVIYDPPAEFHYRRALENLLASLAAMTPGQRVQALADRALYLKGLLADERRRQRHASAFAALGEAGPGPVRPGQDGQPPPP
jgi:hypothetical protein